MLLHARAISRSFAHRPLFTGVSLSIAEGDRMGLIGPNGAGKSTLLRILAGEDTPDDGQVVPARGLRAVYIPQQDVFPEDQTPRAILTAAALAGPIHDHHEAEITADMVLARVGFDEARADSPAGSLSGGWRKRLSIARALASRGGEPDLLLLDEPTNHLDLDAIRWLEELLTRQPSGTAGFASVFVTHDRTFLENIATRIVELSIAYPEGTLAVDGNYSEFLRRKEEFLSGQARAQQALGNQVRKDLAWLARGPQARRTKAKSRIDSSFSRIDQLADLQARNAAAVTAGARVDFTATGRRTRKLLAAKAISKALGGRQLFTDLDVELGVGDCLGLLGPNGSGKTTLIRTLTGDLAPDSGEVILSEPPPRIVVFSQHRRDFHPDTPLREALSPGVDQVRFRGQPMHITAWSRRFLFRDEQLDQPVKSLSGGELARIHIARLMLEPADVLVLDEPTNDLDIPTLETLEEALESFPGALILVTHDRAMLDRLATEILSFDGAGRADYFASLDQALNAQSARAIRPGATPGPAASSPAAAPAAPPARKKLTYNEQREYDTIEQRIAEAEARAAAAEAALADPAVVADHTRMARACAGLEEAQRQVAALYTRWEELESKK
ncbi:MAG: ABC-F family ATP-binding cassette domain-containing protein [Phycisphaerales bacterium]|nr:ABC-F family ATP-binding cassette domain-containing protein [Phycisphaerales bacterium]